MTALSSVTLLDTDTLSAIMRRQPRAVARAQNYLATHGQFTFALITRYEILRGLYAKHATAQIARFERLCMQVLSFRSVMRLWCVLQRCMLISTSAVN